MTLPRAQGDGSERGECVSVTAADLAFSVDKVNVRFIEILTVYTAVLLIKVTYNC